ncbi:polymer-forming cytoskeletal protein [bacterium]|nr:polymer-forming cytoskeletal protein [bacterium]
MFTRGKTPEAPPPPPSLKPASADPQVAVKRPAPGMSRAAVPSIISADVKIVGSVKSEGDIQIDGSIEGDVYAAVLTIGQQGSVQGKVVAETITVQGAVKGQIRGKKVQLATGAKVSGDIYHASLSIEPNAIFEGQVKYAQDPMNPPADAPPAPPSGDGA